MIILGPPTEGQTFPIQRTRSAEQEQIVSDEQTMTRGDNPGDFTVDQVNDFLATLDLSDDDANAERLRVLQAEAERDEPRKGIVEGPHADDPDAPEPAEETPEDEPATPDKSEQGLKAAREEQHALEAEQGFLGDTGETPEGTEPVRPVDESAPEGVSTRREDGVAQVRDLEGQDGFTLATAPPTMSQQRKPRLEGAEYRQGFVGTAPSVEAGVDLTLPAVLARDAERREAEAEQAQG